MNLPSYLFWDIEEESLDYEKNAHFIIKRVIQRGMLDDWIKIKKYYGLEFIKKEILKIRDMDSKTHTFFSCYFGIDKKEFRCSTTQPFSH